MTDFEKLTGLLGEFGVVFTVTSPEDGLIHVDVEDTGGPKNTGYTGFVTTFEFQINGTFVQMGAWE